MRLLSGLVALALLSCACTTKATVERRNRQLTKTAIDSNRPKPSDMRWIPGGEFRMGSENATESPVHEVTVSAFWMDTHELTNAEFAKFVQATGHVTVAEKAPPRDEFPDAPPDKLVPGALVFTGTPTAVPLNDYTQWWTYRAGANWRHPQGPETSLNGKDRYPVVDVAFGDASAYCAWAGKRLPTEAEWEFAARGGLDHATYVWGNHPSEKMANLWQGEFPHLNTAADGFPGIAPVGSFSANGYGLVDMAGNVWEWTNDWYAPFGPAVSAVNPAGPQKSYDPIEPNTQKRVIKGGSFLCNDSYCSGYRPSARMAAEVNTPMEHTGFRCVIGGEAWSK
jgi:formylglycine-generating enzyme